MSSDAVCNKNVTFLYSISISQKSKVMYTFNMDKLIFHIDVNSAYLSWSALEKLHSGCGVDLRTIPAIIGGDMAKRRGVVLAKSIPAKKYGIVTGEPIVNAMRKCPGLTIEPPDHKLYSRQSRRLMALLSGICPDLEQVSVDECYMDYTPIRTHYDSPDEAALLIRRRVREELGFTVNVGISNRKVLAKMASDFQKPDMTHTLYTSEIEQKLWPLPIDSLFMCGRSSAETLRKLEILTVGDLARADLSVIEANLKSHGRLLWEYANGIDDSVVETQHAQAKGIGNSTTLSRDAVTEQEARTVLLSLSESVAGRLRAAGQAAEMISVEIKYSTFRKVSHQTTLPVPTCVSDTIYQTAQSLFSELWDGTPIRLLGIRSSKLLPLSEPVQMSLFDPSFSPAAQSVGGGPKADPASYTAKTGRADSQKERRLEQAIDSIRQKYGADAIVRGSLLDNSKKS